MQMPFRASEQPIIQVHSRLEPVRSVLISLAQLHLINTSSRVDPWLRDAAATLTPAERAENRLIFEGLGAALLPEQESPDFPGYLEQLATRPARRFAEVALAALLIDLPEPAIAHVRSDRAALAGRVQQLYADTELAEQLVELLAKPEQLKQRVLTHLRSRWESGMAAEWQRRQPFLQNMVAWLARHHSEPAFAAELLPTLLGGQAQPAFFEQLHGLRELIVVPSPHLGPLAERFGNPQTLWLFVRARPEQMSIRPPAQRREELLAPLSALADSSRLEILALLAKHEELSGQAIVAQLDLSQSNVSRHLKQLVSSGLLLERRGEGAAKLYRLNRFNLDWTCTALQRLFEGQLDTIVELQPDRRSTEPAQLQRFLNRDGLVVRWPARDGDIESVLIYLAGKFERGRVYTEREVNQLLNRWHTCSDHATLRRYLVDLALLSRTGDNRSYWLE